MSTSLDGVTPWTLLRKSGPSQRPVGLDQVKQTLRLNLNDASLDADLLLKLDGAVEQVEHDIDGALIDQTFTYYRNGFPSARVMQLPKRPVSSVVTIDYLDTDGYTQTLDSDQYLLDEGRRMVALTAGSTWPQAYPQTNSVTVEFVSGFGATEADMPPLVKQAVLVQVGRWFYDPAGELSAGNWQTAYDNIIDRLLRYTYP